MDVPLHVVGAGGHAKVVLSVLDALGIPVTSVLDDDTRTHGSELLGRRVAGATDVLSEHECRAILAIGDNGIRRAIAARHPNVAWLTLVHPAAVVHASATLGSGTVVMAGAILQPEARVGAHTIVNSGAIVDHETVVGDFVHIATGARLTGAVTVGDGAFCGAGCVVLPQRTVGDDATVGAGAVVVHDVAAGATVAGVPARSLS